MIFKDGLGDSPETIRSFLMIGQSNMAGRGELSEAPARQCDKLYMLRMGRWQRLEEPVNPDRPIFSGLYHSGVSMASTFADTIALETGLPVGMIPCADGGTRIEQWMPGEVLFDNAVMTTELAGRTARLSGILWHQGESNCRKGDDPEAYGELLYQMLTALRERLGTVPLLLGELAYRYGANCGIGERNLKLNEVIHRVAAQLPLCAVVSSEGLSMKPDELHFDAAGQAEFGRRYAAAWLRLAGKET
jgi:hypothetical protein